MQAIVARLTTCVRVMHVQKILTHNTMCNVLHNGVVHLVALRESVLLCANAERSEMQVCVYRLHSVEGVLVALQWPGRTAVSGHLPSDKLESTNVQRSKDGIRANVSAQYVNALTNMLAVKCFICTPRADRGVLVQITLSVF